MTDITRTGRTLESGWEESPVYIPPRLLDALQRYVEDGYRTGGFLECFLKNDLAGTLNRADPISRECLFMLLEFLQRFMPADLWGTPERVETWLAKWKEEKEP